MLWNNCMGFDIKLSSKKTSSTAKHMYSNYGWLATQTNNLYEKYDFLNIYEIHFYEEAKFMHYCVPHLQPAIFDDYYKFVNNVSR